MDTEDLAVDDGGEGEVVEDLGAVPPHRDAPILPQALVIEAVDLGLYENNYFTSPSLVVKPG